jgi:hypothetical protein
MGSERDCPSCGASNPIIFKKCQSCQAALSGPGNGAGGAPAATPPAAPGRKVSLAAGGAAATVGGPAAAGPPVKISLGGRAGTGPAVASPSTSPAVSSLPTAAAVRARMVEEITLRLAAGTLADPSFPSAELLPRVAPLPYHHAGHSVLVDTRELALILWGEALAVRDEAKASLWIGVLVQVGAVLACLATLALLALPLGPVGVLIAVVVYFVTVAVFRPKIEEKAAAIRGEALDALLLRRRTPSYGRAVNDIGGKTWITSGDGRVDADPAPVLVSPYDGHPFPGYGPVAEQQVIVCRPKDAHQGTATTAATLTLEVEAALSGLAGRVGLASVTSGRVVVVSERSLNRGSKWLEASGLPRLHHPDADLLEEVKALDRDASARVYSVLEMLIPDQLMCVTFFVRAFTVGTSAACEVCITTLGPPRATWSHVAERLQRHRFEQRRWLSWWTDLGAALLRLVFRFKSTLGGEMNALRRWVAQHLPRFEGSPSLWALRKLDPFNPDEEKEVREELEQLQATTNLWAGRFVVVPNWREIHSAPMTADFFGSTECRAAIRTLYDRVSRAVLDVLDEEGFDVSAYRDDKGRLLINVDRIDQAIIGGNIGSVTRGEAKGKEAKVEAKVKRRANDKAERAVET